jgi:Uma2 family endonuclease
MSRASSVKYTYQDYLQLPEENRYEIIDGELFLTPVPGTDHQRISARLQFWHVRETDVGEIFRRIVEIVRRSEQDFVRYSRFTASETLVSPTSPGLEVPLAEVFAS